MRELGNVLKFLDIVGNYFTLQLFRCAVFGVFLMALVLALRRTCKNAVFIKGLLWSVLLVAPFIGKLKIFYENAFCIRLSGWWTAWCMGHLWVSRVYIAGMAVTFFVLMLRRWRINRFVKGMDRAKIAGTDIFVCSLPITPFTTGVFSPKIVVPEVMLKSYREDGLSEILLHEKTHIRLGHLLFYLIWDILHTLMWVNPLFILCLKYFKEDLEDICDRVTIRKSGGGSYEYGKLLLNSMRLLQNETVPGGVKPPGKSLPFAYCGEEQYLQIKRRVKMVAGYKPYKRWIVAGMAGIATIALTILLVVISGKSYARYQNIDRISIYDITGEKVLLDDSNELRKVVLIDDNVITIDAEKLEALINEKNISEAAYVVSFGGYFKLPGYGGGYGYAIIEQEQLKGAVAKIPYYTSSDLFTMIFKQI